MHRSLQQRGGAHASYSRRKETRAKNGAEAEGEGKEPFLFAGAMGKKKGDKKKPNKPSSAAKDKSVEGIAHNRYVSVSIFSFFLQRPFLLSGFSVWLLGEK